MPRAALFDHWEAHGLRPKGGRGYHLLFHLIAGGTLCYGPWNGTEQDLVLASRWLPAGSSLEARFNGDRVAAVAELLRRYLTSHGPATVRDFAWWTKLGLGEIRSALPLAADGLESDGATEASFWRPGLVEELSALGRRASAPLLLPGFDEFVLGYQDRLFALTTEEHHQLVPGNNGVFKKSIVAGGLIRGIWSRAGRPGRADPRDAGVHPAAAHGVGKARAAVRGLSLRRALTAPAHGHADRGRATRDASPSL